MLHDPDVLAAAALDAGEACINVGTTMLLNREQTVGSMKVGFKVTGIWWTVETISPLLNLAYVLGSFLIPVILNRFQHPVVIFL